MQETDKSSGKGAGIWVDFCIDAIMLNTLPPLRAARRVKVTETLRT